jgi:hypothetical protein
LAGPGTLQTATLIAVGEPSSLQLRLVDPASGGGVVAGLRSCYCDSGGPVFEWSGGRFVLIGVLSWSDGPNMSGFTGGNSACALSWMDGQDRAGNGQQGELGLVR